MAKYEWLEEYLSSKKGAERDYKLEWEWHRWMVGGKMYAAVCSPDEKHKTYGGHELLTLKCEPMLSEALQAEFPDILPGFYMDKKNWISVFLEGGVPDDTLRSLIDRSYQLVFEKLTKKLQKEISEK